MGDIASINRLAAISASFSTSRSPFVFATNVSTVTLIALKLPITEPSNKPLKTTT